MTRHFVPAAITVVRGGVPVSLIVHGHVSVSYGEDARGDTVRYLPRIESIEVEVGDDRWVAWDDSLSPDEETSAEDALCEAAHWREAS